MSKESNNAEWIAGYLCAVATLLLQHGDRGYAKDLIRCVNLPPDNDIEEVDRMVLKEHGLLESEAGDDC